jgi:hypothetical protein
MRKWRKGERVEVSSRVSGRWSRGTYEAVPTSTVLHKTVRAREGETRRCVVARGSEGGEDRALLDERMREQTT